MSRTRVIPPVPEHVDPDKVTERKAKAIRRQQGRGRMMPHVVAGASADAIARVLGTKKKEDGE